MTIEKERIAKRIKEEFLYTTDTLWENEVSANLFVSKVLLFTAAIDATVLILTFFNIFTVRNNSTYSFLIDSFIALVLAAMICQYYKGQKRWLKLMLLFIYSSVVAGVSMILGHNVVLLMVFPLVLSVRYYSYIVTFIIGILSLVGTIVAYYIGTISNIIRIDLNMVEIPAGTELTYDHYTLLREAVETQLNLDPSRLWLHTLQHSLLPKIILFFMLIYICVQIAKKGREMIFAQKQETMKSERLATELDLASTIQSSMLPSIFPPFPDRNEFEIFASMDPAKEVGGDFYDFYLIDEDHLALLIADVSGKGIPAAMFMMASKIIINNFSLLGDAKPDVVLAQANKRITSNNPSEMFVTVWFAVLEISTGRVVASNGGHEYPYIYHQATGKFEKLKDRHGLVLGAMDFSKYNAYEFQLEPGDALFVYTDGVPEATNIDNEQFGDERLDASLNQDPTASPDILIKNMQKDIAEFVNDAPQFDDTTMLALRYHGPHK
ncbi:MAG: serine/threonine-protein phosphatase [Solobacterium sp.]|nr:serine/threonine-protein phosphatase [Solobacterium sp.]